MKTKFCSYCLNGIAEGCKFCVKGEKLVLFISGKCKRNCWYCSLSKKRKNKDIIFANEREIKNERELIEEIKESRATSCGITGGDPLLFINRTIKFAEIMRNKFGKKFHIHIYLPTKYINEEKLRQLSKYVDEVRFHPELLFIKNSADKDMEKIRLAGLFWNKPDIGIELPLIPEKKKQILEFILQIKDYIGFVNLNEFELSETNFELVTRKYKLKKGGYVVAKSKDAGLWILNELKKKKIKLKVHLCTADLKNNFQYRNRLMRHKIMKFGKRTKDGTVIYLVVKGKMKEGFYDKDKKRTIINTRIARKLIGKRKVLRVEEFPTYDRQEIEVEELE